MDRLRAQLASAEMLARLKSTTDLESIARSGRWDLKRIGAQGAESLKQIGAQGQNARDLASLQLNLGGEWDLKRLAAAEAARQARFQQVLPLYNQALGRYDEFLQNWQQGGGFGNNFQFPTAPPPTQQATQGTPPKISAAPPMTPGMVQQQVNAGYAGAEQKAQAATQQARNSISSRGFSSQSPAMMGIASANQMAALGQGAENERQTRLGAAQMNAGHVLDAQRAQEAQYGARQQEALGYANFQNQQQIAAMDAAARLAAAQLDAQSKLASGFLGGGFLGSYLS